MSDAETALNELQKLGSGLTILGKVALPEEEFYIGLMRLKKWVVSGQLDTTPLSPAVGALIAQINEFEDTVVHAPI